MTNHLHYGDNLTCEQPARRTRFRPVPRQQIVIIEQAMSLRERAVCLPARREDTFKRAAREEDTKRQGARDL